MITTFWIVVFIVSLYALVKGSDWFLASSEKVGLALGLSPFVVGILIVGVGTSFPELVSSFAALYKGVSEIIPANAVGSNIANILLIVGISAIAAKKLVVTKNLIDLDLPLLAIVTVLILGVLWDGVVILPEAILLVIAYGIYIAYTIYYKDDSQTRDYKEVGDIIPSREERRHAKDKNHLKARDVILLGVGLIALVLGARFLIDSVIALSSLFSIAPGVIAITAVAFGTSLPELLVSMKAALKKKSEVALGGIFGSNVFNVLVVIGLPGLFSDLSVDSQTLTFGLPALAAATLLFVISGISKRIHVWEGLMYVILYLLFITKLLGLF